MLNTDHERRILALEHAVRILTERLRDVTQQAIQYSLAADVTFTRDDLRMRHFINCTVASVVHLPRLELGEEVLIKNVGTQTITVKDEAGNTVGTIASGELKTTMFTGASAEVFTL